MQEQAHKLTTASGRPYVENDNTMTAGPRGPVLLQDYILHEKMAHFNRERIPERVVHAKGAGAYGTFTVTHDITPYTRAKLFSEIGKQTRVFVRFSTVGGEKGSADTERDPRGFAVKFYTKLTFRTPSDGDPRIFSAARFARTANSNRDMVSLHERRSVTHLCLRSVVWGSCYRLSKPTRSNICPL